MQTDLDPVLAAQVRVSHNELVTPQGRRAATRPSGPAPGAARDPEPQKTDLVSLDQIAYGGERSVIQYILVNTLIDIKSPRGETEPTAGLGQAPRS